MPKPATVPKSLSGRRRWKIVEARSVLAALAASGLSLPEFARQQRLEPERLRRWQRRLARGAHPASPAVIELRPSASPRLWRAEAIEIVMGSGVTLRVSETIDPATLARLVTALRGC